nr:uncharacterized protein LOC117275043 [Nicotiana tomentosiformis]
MRPLSGEEDVPLKSPAPKQGDEKKRKRVSSSPNSEKKKPKKRSRKPKGSTDALSSDSIHRLRDESEEEEEEEEEKSQLVTRVRTGVVMLGSSEPADVEIGLSRHEEVDEGVLAEAPKPEGVEATPPQAKGVERETGGDASRIEEGIPRDELRVIDITGSPQILDAMIREAGMLESRSYEGPQGAIDIHHFLDRFESTAFEDITGLGDLPVPNKVPSPRASGSSSSQKLVNRFPAPSVDPGRRRLIAFFIPEYVSKIIIFKFVSKGNRAKSVAASGPEPAKPRVPLLPS